MLTRKLSKVKKQATIFELQRPKPEIHETVTIDLTDEGDATNDNDPAILCPVCGIKMSVWKMNVRISHVEECLSLLTIKESELQVSVSSSHIIQTEVGSLHQEDTKSPKIEGEQSLEAKDVDFFKREATCSQIGKESRIDIKKREPEEGVQKPSQSASKKPKHKSSAAQLEMKSFINTKPPEKLTKRKQRQPEKANTKDSLLPCSRKNEIPDLKILKFAKDTYDNHLIAVDAFCYKPHDCISQYFLSHFHSDHYGGFSKRWSRERTIDKKIIYCSEITANLLMIRFNAEPEFIFQLKTNSRYKVWSYNTANAVKNEANDTENVNGPEIFTHDGYISEGGFETSERTPGLYVTPIDANHCPGATIFLFESIPIIGECSYSLHCGDFRVSKTMLEHPALLPFYAGREATLQNVYLDTTYMSPQYNFPLQETVCNAAATMIEKLAEKGDLYNEWLGNTLQSRITDFLLFAPKARKKTFLVLVGTYLIGKEKLAIAVLQRMGSCPIYISNISSRGDKGDIVASFKDDYLDSVITQDDTGSDSKGEVVVHLVPMKIVGSSSAISAYFNHNKYFEHFEKCIGFRPTGWAIQDAQSRFASVDESADLPLATLAKILKNRPNYTYMDILSQKRPQSDKTLDKPTFKIYSLPYSEHLSFRELSFFAVWLSIGELIPTVNTEHERSRAEMSRIIEKWETCRKLRVDSMAGLGHDPHGFDCLTLASL